MIDIPSTYTKSTYLTQQAYQDTKSKLLLSMHDFKSNTLLLEPKSIVQSGQTLVFIIL